MSGPITLPEISAPYGKDNKLRPFVTVEAGLLELHVDVNCPQYKLAWIYDEWQRVHPELPARSDWTDVDIATRFGREPAFIEHQYLLTAALCPPRGTCDARLVVDGVAYGAERAVPDFKLMFGGNGVNTFRASWAFARPATWRAAHLVLTVVGVVHRLPLPVETALSGS